MRKKSPGVAKKRSKEISGAVRRKSPGVAPLARGGTKNETSGSPNSCGVPPLTDVSGQKSPARSPVNSGTRADDSLTVPPNSACIDTIKANVIHSSDVAPRFKANAERVEKIRKGKVKRQLSKRARAVAKQESHAHLSEVTDYSGIQAVAPVTKARRAPSKRVARNEEL